MEDLGTAHIDDYETIQKEWEFELSLKQKYSSTQDNTQNPTITPVDNNAQGKSIQE